MKKLMIVLGSLGALLLWAGSILKMLHLSPAGILLVFGTGITVLGFFPLFFYSSYKEQVEKKNILLSGTGYLTLSFLIIGVLFNVQHWPGATTLLLIGQFLLVLLFLPIYLVNAYKKAGEAKARIAYTILIVLIGFGVIFMVSATRLSRKIVNDYDIINNNANYVSDKFSQQNEALIKSLKTHNSYSEIQPKVDKLRELAFTLNKQIETIKTELKSNVDQDGTIKFKDDTKAFGNAMLKDNNANKLKNDFAKYKEVVLQLTTDEYQKETLNALLDFQLFTGLTYVQGFKETSLIVGLTMLSNMQKNIKIAEYEVLSSIK